MTMRMKFFGYDCDIVDKHLRDMDIKQRQASSALMEQCLAQAEHNKDLAVQIGEMSRKLEESQTVEKNIVDRLAEQLHALQQAYEQGFKLIEQKNVEINTQVQRIEGKKQLLNQWKHQASR